MNDLIHFIMTAVPPRTWFHPHKFNMRKSYKFVYKHKLAVGMSLFLLFFFFMTIFTYWRVAGTDESIQNEFVVKVGHRRNWQEQPNIHDPKKSRISHYCNEPQNIAAGDEGIPEKYLLAHKINLSSLIIVIRHGDRGPLRAVRNLHRVDCDPYDTEEPEFSITKYSHGFVRDEDIQRLREFSAFAELLYSKRETTESPKFNLFFKGACDLGELTRIGTIQHILLGSQLAKSYSGQLNFDPQNSKDIIKAFTTPFPRTYQSAVSFIYGFLNPISDLHYDNFPEIVVTEGTFFCGSNPGCSQVCPKLVELSSQIEQWRDELTKSFPTVMKLLHRVRNHLASTVNESIIFSSPESVFDGLMAYLCHRSSLPCFVQPKRIDDDNGAYSCITLAESQQLIAYVDYHHRQLANFEKFQKSNWIRMIGFFYQVLYYLDEITVDRPVPKLVLYSAHDITLAPIASALNFYDGLIPPYASRIVFEIYRRNGARNELNQESGYLRIIYNGKAVTSNLEACKSFDPQRKCLTIQKDEKQFTLIPIDKFKRFIRYKFKEMTKSTNYVDSCRL